MNTKSFLVCFIVVMLATSVAMAGTHHGNFAPAGGGLVRNGTGSFHGGNWNGGHWNGGNWGGNWHHHHHDNFNDFVFVGGFGFPFFGYPYGYGYYPYGYGYGSVLRVWVGIRWLWCRLLRQQLLRLPW